MNEIKFSITKNSKLFALFINISNPKENFEITKQYFKSDNPSDLISDALQTNCDILALRFNTVDFDGAVSLLKSELKNITKPLMICGTTDNETDKILLPKLIKVLDRPCIISNANEKTYKHIVPYAVEGGHYLVLKTPIDINLAKELNILSNDMGLDLSKIIMNTDIGGLGYGYEYGFSIMEKVRQEGEKNDKFLDLPLLSEASLEALKTKEAKSKIQKAQMIELASCAGVIAAGANIITVCSPDNISILKGLV